MPPIREVRTCGCCGSDGSAAADIEAIGVGLPSSPWRSGMAGFARCCSCTAIALKRIVDAAASASAMTPHTVGSPLRSDVVAREVRADRCRRRCRRLSRRDRCVVAEARGRTDLEVVIRNGHVEDTPCGWRSSPGRLESCGSGRPCCRPRARSACPRRRRRVDPLCLARTGVRHGRLPIGVAGILPVSRSCRSTYRARMRLIELPLPPTGLPHDVVGDVVVDGLAGPWWGDDSRRPRSASLVELFRLR